MQACRDSLADILHRIVMPRENRMPGPVVFSPRWCYHADGCRVPAPCREKSNELWGPCGVTRPVDQTWASTGLTAQLDHGSHEQRVIIMRMRR